ncbi:hypothetical protein [Lentzea californiensis]|uniref:hypothetical protein n=1 Tax=Lentzea californiensis TaxID=438851 RepID=UPI002165EAD5|nr:hypothetical protein [Lentzea californiensis]
MAVDAGVVDQHVDLTGGRGQRDAGEPLLRVQAHLYDVVPETRGTERAAVALALIAGFWLLRKVIGSTTSNETDEETLAVTLRQLFELLLP